MAENHENDGKGKGPEFVFYSRSPGKDREKRSDIGYFDFQKTCCSVIIKARKLFRWQTKKNRAIVVTVHLCRQEE